MDTKQRRIIRRKVPPRPEKKPDDMSNMTMFEVSQKHFPYTWHKLFTEFAKDELEDISTKLDRLEKRDGSYFPLKCNLFRAFELCPANKIKVVIFGQDPYHQFRSDGMPRAQGMSFSVERSDAIPSSLQNIYKEIQSDVGIGNYSHGDLTKWAEQGVLLLNTCLTVKPDEAKSHKKLWLPFIKKVLEFIPTVNEQCIYVLWGNEAKSIKPLIMGTPPVLESGHPSGFSAKKHYFGNKHFSQINLILQRQNRVPIDWNLEV